MTSHFSVYANKFTSTIPTQYGQLTNMVYSIWLGNNEFTSHIPTELGSATLMREAFELYSNDLTGTVPSQLGQFAVLTVGKWRVVARSGQHRLSKPPLSPLRTILHSSLLQAFSFRAIPDFATSYPQKLGLFRHKSPRTGKPQTHRLARRVSTPPGIQRYRHPRSPLSAPLSPSQRCPPAPCRRWNVRTATNGTRTAPSVQFGELG